MASPNSTGKPRLIPAVLYLRRSTKEQADSIVEQRKAVLEYAEQRGYWIVREYVDDGISGDDTEKRHDFLRMLSDARELGDFEAILCWDDSRFGRFDSIEAGYYIFPLRKSGVYLDTVTGGKVDWRDSICRIVSGVKHEQNHDDNVKRAANVTRGQLEAAEAGSWSGSPPYAYRLEGPKKHKQLLLGDPAAVRLVKRIFTEFVGEGRSLHEIARRLNADGIVSPRGLDWRYDAVRSILSNVAYVGTFRHNVSSRSKYYHASGGKVVRGGRSGRNDPADWIVKHDHHEAIIDAETFDKAQAILAKGKTGRSPHKSDESPYLFPAGKLRCGLCGATLWGMGDGKYGCSNKDYRGYSGKDGCPGTLVREQELLTCLDKFLDTLIPLDERIELDKRARSGLLREDELPEAFTRIKKLVTLNEPPPINRPRVERQLNEIDTRIEKAKRNLARVDEEFIDSVQADIRAFQSERATLAAELNTLPTPRDINQTVANVLQRLLVLKLSLRHPLEVGGARVVFSGRKMIRRALLDIDFVEVHTSFRGHGKGIRYSFERGEIHLAGVGGVTSNSNLHHRVQSPAACR
jgi:site-specific DNA recombinase